MFGYDFWMNKSQKDKIETLEQGDIYFLYRPKIGEFAPQGTQDVQKLYVILKPENQELFRLMVVAEKRLPKAYDEDKYWGYIESVMRSAEEIKQHFSGRVYTTKTVGERGQPSGRPAGEGIYRIVRHGNHSHFVYSLSFPKTIGPVQKDLGLQPEANMIISLINPNTPTPRQVDLSRISKVNYPPDLNQQFGKRKFLSLNTTTYLNYPGTLVLLIAVSRSISDELGISLEVEAESKSANEVFEDLKLERSRHRTEPLFKGRWA